MNGSEVKPVTVQKILDCHAQFGTLDFEMVKKSMGPNWPSQWENAPIFDRREGFSTRPR